MTITISQSNLNLHRECPQKWTYRTLRGLDRRPSLNFPAALVIGSWWHAVKAAHAITRGRDLGSLPEDRIPETITTVNGGPILPNTATVGDVFEEMSAYWSRLPALERASYVDQRDESLLDTLNRLWDRHLARWGEDEKHEHPLAVEFPFRKRITTTDDGTEMYLEGIADEIYLDTRTGMVVLRDSKAEADLPAATLADDMMKSQLQVYGWGLNGVVKEWGHGPIRMISYDRIRTVRPATPKVTVSGSLAKTPSDYDLTTYLAWAEAGVPWGKVGEYVASGANKGKPKFGVYEVEPKVVENLSKTAEQDKWSRRTLTPLNKNIVMSHMRAAVGTALDVENTKARVSEHGEATRNFGRQCGWCPFAELCRAEMVGGPGGDYDPEDYGLYLAPKRDR